MFNNKTILITGATGSFGKTFIKLLLKKYKLKKLSFLAEMRLSSLRCNNLDNLIQK